MLQVHNRSDSVCGSRDLRGDDVCEVSEARRGSQWRHNRVYEAGHGNHQEEPKESTVKS